MEQRLYDAEPDVLDTEWTLSPAEQIRQNQPLVDEFCKVYGRRLSGTRINYDNFSNTGILEVVYTFNKDNCCNCNCNQDLGSASEVIKVASIDKIFTVVHFNRYWKLVETMLADAQREKAEGTGDGELEIVTRETFR